MQQSRPSRIWRPYTQELTAPPALPIASGDGAYLTSQSGQKILDGISSWWTITHGHCHPAIVDAIRHQVGQLDQVIFANFSHEPAEELAELLAEITPKSLTRTFFSDNGSTAVEVALKMALQASAQRGFPERRKFLAFSEAYHGDTAGAMSVSGQGLFTRPYQPMIFEVLRAAQPRHSQVPAGEWLKDFKRMIEIHGKEIAGVIIEPLVQGAAGMIMWPDSVVREIAQICNDLGIYLIFDEVMTGFGRTGSLFAMDRLGVVPDLVCLSKGLTGGVLPLGLTLASEAIYETFLSEEKARMFFHGHSFTGNPISCAAAVANLKIFRSENVFARLQTIESVHRRRLPQLARRVPTIDHRVCGTIGVLELESPDPGYASAITKDLHPTCLKNGLFLRPLGNVVYLLPPYSSREQDLHFAWDVIEDALTSASADR